MTSAAPWLPRPFVTAAVALVLACHAWLALSATIGMGITGDESAHITAGYSYWKLNDYRLQPENGNLPQRWATLPLFLLHPSPRMVPADAPDIWARSHVWRLGEFFLFQSGNDTEYLILCARTAALTWSIACALLVFFWSRRLWGDLGGLLSLSLFCFSPTALAHGPLVTSDMCATFWLLAAAGSLWRTLQRVTAPRLALSLATCGLAAVAKFSCVLLLPTAAVMVGIVILSRSPLPIGAARAARSRWAKLSACAVLALVHVAVAIGVVWLFFGFRYSAFTPAVHANSFYADWPDILPPSGPMRSFITLLREHHLLPEAYVQGFTFVLKTSKERGAFLAGHFKTTGWWYFFPYAYLVKSSLIELITTLVLLILAALRWTRGGPVRLAADLSRILPLVVFGGVYGLTALASHLNIGHRHILPLYPILAILAGFLARPTLGRRGFAAFVLIVSCAATEALAAYPLYLAYFNAVAGGGDAGWRHLVDSSLDWGQNVPRLADWLRDHRRPGERAYVSMFGTDDIYYHGIQAYELSPVYGFGRVRTWTELQPGLYCISATMLQDVYSPYSGPWKREFEGTYRRLLRMMRSELAAGTRSPRLGEFGLGPENLMWNLDRLRFARLCFYLRNRKPEAVIGHSIFVFRLRADEVHTVVDGTTADLVRAIDAAANHAP